MAYILPHLSNASILNTGLALQNSGLKTMLNSTVSGLQDLSNYYAKQEDARYKNALLNSGILNSFNVANKGTEYATVLPNQTQDGTNIYSLLNQNIQGMTNERRSKIFNDLLRQRQYNYQTESKLLQSNINQTKNKQANSLLSYLSTLQDKNNDGSIDINDLNQTERSGILNNGALYDSVQSKLLGQAFKDKNQYLQTQAKQGYNKKLQDEAFKKQKILKYIDFNNKRILEQDRFNNKLKLLNLSQKSNTTNNKNYTKYLSNIKEINQLAINKPYLFQNIDLTGIDLNNPIDASILLKTVKSNKDSKDLNILNNKVNVLNDLYKQTGDETYKLLYDSFLNNKKLYDYQSKDKINGIINDKYINIIDKKLSDIPKNNKYYTYIDNNQTYTFPNESAINDILNNAKYAYNAGIINKNTLNEVKNKVNNALNVNNVINDRENSLSLSSFINAISHPTQNTNLNNLKQAEYNLAYIFDDAIPHDSKLDANGLHFLSNPKEYGSYFEKHPEAKLLFQKAVKDEYKLKRLPTWNEVLKIFYDNMYQTNLTKIRPFTYDANIKKGSIADKILTRALSYTNK